MKIYDIELTFDVISTDHTLVEDVYANSKQEAVEKAIEMFYKNSSEYDLYSGKNFESNISTNLDNHIIINEEEVNN